MNQRRLCPLDGRAELSEPPSPYGPDVNVHETGWEFRSQEFRRAVSRDPDDDYLIALAQATNVDHLVSGDKDLTSLAATVSPPVLSTAAFLDLL